MRHTREHYYSSWRHQDWAWRLLELPNLTSIIIPDGVTRIEDFTFHDCSSLTSIIIPDGITSIGFSAFYSCYNLGNIAIPDGVVSIGSDAFRYCRSLTSITIPDSLASIGNWAFAECWSLTSITFKGAAPTVAAGSYPSFFGIPEGATAYIQERFIDSFGAVGSTWNGLILNLDRPVTITRCGFLNSTTFFIEFEPAGTGYRVMSNATLDFGNAVEVTPTLEPISAEDNRFEFAASGARNFYRLEPAQ